MLADERSHRVYVDPSIPRSIHGWHSPRLGLDMPVVCYGDWGHPLLILPTAQADFLENERFYLIKSIEPLIHGGKVRVFSIDSINRHAWMNRSVSIPEAARRQALYSSYIEEEVVPFIRDAVDNRSARIGITGASFGAFHAANQFFRRPDMFDGLIAMSGFYDLEPDYTHGYMNDDLYFNNPVSFVSNLSGAHTYDLLHHSRIVIVTGQGDYEKPDNSRRFSDVLRQKDIPHELDLWGHDIAHDWPSWRKMLPYHLGKMPW